MKKDLKVVQRCYYWIVSVVIVSETWIRPLDSASHHHSNRNTRNNPSPSSTQFRKRNSNQKLAKKYPFESYWEKSTNRRRKPKNRETLAVPGKKGGELRFQSIDFFCSDSNCKIKRKKKKKNECVFTERERRERWSSLFLSRPRVFTHCFTICNKINIDALSELSKILLLALLFFSLTAIIFHLSK